MALEPQQGLQTERMGDHGRHLSPDPYPQLLNVRSSFSWKLCPSTWKQVVGVGAHLYSWSKEYHNSILAPCIDVHSEDLVRPKMAIHMYTCGAPAGATSLKVQA